MKKVVKILLILLILGVIALVIYLVAKKKQDKYDREHLNGRTRAEFFELIRPEWKTKWIDGSKEYIRGMDLTVIFPNDSGSKTYYAGEPIPSIGGLKYLEYTPSTSNWIGNIFKKAMDNNVSFEEQLNTDIDYLWSKDSPNPMSVDWIGYWLPQLIDNFGINYNDVLVQKLIYKI